MAIEGHAHDLKIRHIVAFAVRKTRPGQDTGNIRKKQVLNHSPLRNIFEAKREAKRRATKLP